MAQSYTTGGKGSHGYGRSPAGLPGGEEGGPAWGQSDNQNAPPYWGPEKQSIYPFKIWAQDAEMWSMGSNIAVGS